MSYELYQQIRDEQLQKSEALAARESQIEAATQLYYEGEFDGKIGSTPSHPESQEYWQGFCRGLRDYWLSQQGKVLATEF